MPSLNKLIGDSDQGVQKKIIELIGKLANHGKCQFKGIAAQLTRSMK
jgi:hypothetical protein